MVASATFYGLPPRVLPSIQAVEGGQIGTIHVNLDGSEDLGLMQINTRWMQPLAQYTGMTPAMVRDRLLADACFNIAAAAAILRSYLNEARGDLMLAIAYYHSHTPARGLDYQARVVRSAEALFSGMNNPRR
jgi:soluble lytic murein transglycosylase-like protein